MNFNILITGVGRHVSIIRNFRRAMKQLGISGTLIGADTNSFVAGMWVVDERRALPRPEEGSYVDAVLEICRKESVRLLVPLGDEDLLALAFRRNDLMAEGTLVLLSDPDTVQICSDLMLSREFFSQHDIACPRAYDVAEVLAGAEVPEYPVVLRSAAASAVDLHTVDTAHDLMFFARKVHDAAIEERVAGLKMAIDVYVGLDGMVRTVVPRLGIHDHDGTPSAFLTLLDTEICQKARSVVDALPGPLGPLTLHGVLEEKTGDLKIHRIDPRYDKGVSASILSGADSPVWAISELLGMTISWNSVVVQDRCLMMAYDQEILIDNSEMTQGLVPRPAVVQDAAAAPAPVAAG